MVAEVIAEWWAREIAAGWPDMIVLTETDALDRPTFRQAVDDWRHRDFSAYAADAARREARWPVREDASTSQMGRPAALPLGFNMAHAEPPSPSSSSPTALHGSASR